jgi:hypothetical protein
VVAGAVVAGAAVVVASGNGAVIWCSDNGVVMV